MRKLFGVLIIFISILSTINSRDYWKCNEDGSIKCNTSQTCCRSKVNESGFECMPMQEAVCCSSGIGACPKGYACDLLNNSCYFRPVNFLSTSASAPTDSNTNNQIRILQSTNQNKNPNPIVNNLKKKPLRPTMEFINSFIDGIAILQHVQDNSNCLENNDFFSNVLLIIAELNGLKFDETLPKALEKIGQTLIDNKQIYLNELSQCLILKENIENRFIKIYKILNDTEYLSKLSAHSVLYLAQIRESFEEIKTLYKENKENKWEELGLACGKFVRFVFLWSLDEK
jgi:hypothetical protein